MDQLICLGFEVTDSDEVTFKALPPELKLFDLTEEAPIEIYNDEVASKNYERLSLNDYHLGKFINIEKNLPPEYYLISTTDAIRIQELQLKDHFQWYLARSRYLQAWKISKYVVDVVEQLKVGLQYLNQLIISGDWEKVYTMTPQILNLDQLQEKEKMTKENSILKNGWNDILDSILKSGNIDSIVDNIPSDPLLENGIYDNILEYYLSSSKLLQFLTYIEKWSSQELFSIEHFEKVLENKIEESSIGEKQNYYRRAVVLLYLHQERYSKAIPHMITLHDEEIFNILNSQNLLSQFSDQVIDILMIPYYYAETNRPHKYHSIEDMPLDYIESIFTKSIELITINRKRISVKKLIEKFQEHTDLTKLLFLILKKLSIADPSLTIPFEDQLVELYTNYERNGLLNFLKTKSNYNIDEAIRICSTVPGLSNELIYLWGRIGETKKALSLIIDELNDPKLAIEFVKSWGDTELWDFMISYSWNKPVFIKALLESTDNFGETHLEVIKGMSNDIEIEGLHSTLDKILRENTLNLKVNNRIYKIVDDETISSAAELLKLRDLGKCFDVDEESDREETYF